MNRKLTIVYTITKIVLLLITTKKRMNYKIMLKLNNSLHITNTLSQLRIGSQDFVEAVEGGTECNSVQTDEHELPSLQHFSRGAIFNFPLFKSTNVLIKIYLNSTSNIKSNKLIKKYGCLEFKSL